MALRGHDDDEDAPWLASAEPDGRETYVSGRRFRIVAILLGVLVVLVAALIYAVVAKPGQNDELAGGFEGEVPLIRAPDTPFRTRPVNAGGMTVEGVDQTSYEAAGGVDPEGQLALDQLPEEPMARPVAQAPVHAASPVVVAPAPVAPPAPPSAPTTTDKKPVLPEVKKVAPAPVKSVAEKPAPKVIETPKPSKDRLADVLDTVDKKTPKAMPDVTSGSGSFSLQLGAFSSNAKAEEAWKKFSSRFSYLAGLSKSIVKIDREEGGALYRLRATGVESREKANNLCARMRVAGDQCQVAE